MSNNNKHVHHGKTPAAWASSMIALFGFLVLCLGFILGPEGLPSVNMPIVYVGAALCVLAPVVGGIMNKAGMGQD